jgi:hypothetical protein
MTHKKIEVTWTFSQKLDRPILLHIGEHHKHGKLPKIIC